MENKNMDHYISKNPGEQLLPGKEESKGPTLKK